MGNSFERYTEEARCAVFYAGFEAVDLGSSYVETEHLLLGLMRVNPDDVNRFAISEVAYASIRDQIVAHTRICGAVPKNIEPPLSDETKNALSFATKEADALGHQHTGTEHLLLGLLLMHDSLAARILRERGAEIERMRRELKSAARSVPMESRKNSLSEEVARMVREKVRMVFEGGPDAVLASKRFAADNWPAFHNLEEASGLTSMPECYSEKARRSIFFARYEASQLGSPVVETEHLLLGVLREDKAHLDLYLPSTDSIAAIRKQIEEHSAVSENSLPGERLPAPMSFPLSDECERALACAEEEAVNLSSERVGPEHLLLGLLREESSFAAQLLREHGAEIERIRSGLTASPNQPPSNPADPSQPSDPAA
jgi:ATP-dependent Clp protease ATP-binding subunit ClpA